MNFDFEALDKLNNFKFENSKKKTTRHVEWKRKQASAAAIIIFFTTWLLEYFSLYRSSSALLLPSLFFCCWREVKRERKIFFMRVEPKTCHMMLEEKSEKGLSTHNIRVTPRVSFSFRSLLNFLHVTRSLCAKALKMCLGLLSVLSSFDRQSRNIFDRCKEGRFGGFSGRNLFH